MSESKWALSLQTIDDGLGENQTSWFWNNWKFSFSELTALSSFTQHLSTGSQNLG